MDKDVREAAERLRAKNYIDKRTLIDFSLREHLDMAKLAEAYLAEHPADSDEPITEDWLWSVGFAWSGSDQPMMASPASMKVGPICQLRYSPHYGCDGWAVSDGGEALIPPCETRGELRQLARALGIPLSEPPDKLAAEA